MDADAYEHAQNENDPCPVFSDVAGSNHSGHGNLPAHMQYAYGIAFCTVQNPAGYMAEAQAIMVFDTVRP